MDDIVLVHVPTMRDALRARMERERLSARMLSNLTGGRPYVIASFLRGTNVPRRDGLSRLTEWLYNVPPPRPACARKR